MWRNEANDKNAGGIQKKILRSWRKWYDCEATLTRMYKGMGIYRPTFMYMWSFSTAQISLELAVEQLTSFISFIFHPIVIGGKALKVLPFFGPPLLDLGGILQIDVNCTTGLWEMIILQLCNTWFVEFGYIRVTVVPLSYYVRATLVTFFVFVLHSPGFRLTFVSFSQYIPIVRLHFVSHSSLSVHSRVFFVLFSSYSFNLRVYSSLFRLYSSQTKNSRTSHEQGE